MSKSIPTADLRKQFMSNIDLWLESAKGREAEAGNLDVGSFMWLSADGESRRYDSMAHALYLLGKSLGVISENDYPQFKQGKEDEP